MANAPAARRFFPPEVATQLVKMACESPDTRGASLSQWDCAELAKKLVAEGIVKSISRQSVWRILHSFKLKPWRHHMWLSLKVPHDEAFAARVKEIISLYTRELLPGEMVLCLDEKTSLQPRPRKSPTLPAQPGLPVRVEHEYVRYGMKAVHLLAAFDTRSGQVYAITRHRNRQLELIEFLEHLNQKLPADKTRVHLILDNCPVHHGKLVREWIENHPRFVLEFLPTHCSWMNQIEQWFGIVTRKRLAVTDFKDDVALTGALMRFVEQWNQHAHPFNWTAASADKILAKCQLRQAA
jgi:transposase